MKKKNDFCCCNDEMERDAKKQANDGKKEVNKPCCDAGATLTGIIDKCSGENGLKFVNGKRILRKAGKQEEVFETLDTYKKGVLGLVDGADSDDYPTLLCAYRSTIKHIGEKFSKLPSLDTYLYRHDTIGDESWTGTCLAGYYRLTIALLQALAGYEEAVKSYVKTREDKTEEAEESDDKEDEFFERMKIFKQGR
jgi:hypothetical protein